MKNAIHAGYEKYKVVGTVCLHAPSWSVSFQGRNNSEKHFFRVGEKHSSEYQSPQCELRTGKVLFRILKNTLGDTHHLRVTL